MFWKIRVFMEKEWIKGLHFCSDREKYNYFLHYLCYFWQETGSGHKSKNQNQNLTCPISPTWFLVNFIWKILVPAVSSFEVKKEIRPKLCGNCAFPQNFHTRKLGEIRIFCAVLDFKVWLLFFVPSISYLYAKYNAETIGNNFRSQKLTFKKLACPFLISLFHFEAN